MNLQEAGENCIWRSSIIFTLHQILSLSGLSNRGMKLDGACSAHVGDEKCVQNVVGILEGKRSLGRPKRR
jgi:hypothetical protein